MLQTISPHVWTELARMSRDQVPKPSTPKRLATNSAGWSQCPPAPWESQSSAAPAPGVKDASCHPTRQAPVSLLTPLSLKQSFTLRDSAKLNQEGLRLAQSTDVMVETSVT